MGNAKLRNVLESLIRSLKREGHNIKGYKKIDVKQTEHSPEYHETIRDLKRNLRIFEDEIKEIKTQYKPYSFENGFKEEFGEELSPDDFQYQDRINAYCERNGVSPEGLHELKRERLKLREAVNNEIFHRVTLAKGILFHRDGNCPDFMLSRVVRFEEMYGDRKQAAKYKEILDKVRAEKIKIKEGARWDILNYASDRIIANINPYGKEPELQENWVKAIDLVEKELQARGISIEEYERNKETREVWTKVNAQMRQERNEELELEKFFARAQEAEKSSVQISQQNTAEKEISGGTPARDSR
jgi:hypothetical protein